MSFFTKNSVFLSLLGLLAFSSPGFSQFLCEQTFYYQKAVLYTLTGNNVDNLELISEDTLVQNTGFVPNVHYSSDYSYQHLPDYIVPLKLKSECNPYPTSPNTSLFTVRDTTDKKTKLAEIATYNRYADEVGFANGPTIKNTVLVYFDTAAPPSQYITKDSTDGIYKATFGSAVYFDTLRSSSGTLKVRSRQAMAWKIYFDSSDYMEKLMVGPMSGEPTDHEGWNDPSDIATRTVIAHILVAHYDTVEAFDYTTPVSAKLPQRAPIQISRHGAMYQILVPQTHRINETASLDIINIRGQKLISLYSQTGVFQWDSKNQAGEKVKQGLYLVKFGNQQYHKLFVQ